MFKELINFEYSVFHCNDHLLTTPFSPTPYSMFSPTMNKPMTLFLDLSSLNAPNAQMLVWPSSLIALMKPKLSPVKIKYSFLKLTT